MRFESVSPIGRVARTSIWTGRCTRAGWAPSLGGVFGKGFCGKFIGSWTPRTGVSSPGHALPVTIHHDGVVILAFSRRNARTFRSSSSIAMAS
jgi:hypothetical protein